MEREAKILKCSKLNNYAEFNKMVQAVSRKAASSTRPNSTARRSQKQDGSSSSEHCFYSTLSLMLRKVVSDPNPEMQKEQLLQVYKWFSLNKSLLSSTNEQGFEEGTKKKKKPSLVMKNEVFRPNTAPTFAVQTESVSSQQRRPHTTPCGRRAGFTSSFMRRSLAMGTGMGPGAGRGASRSDSVAPALDSLRDTRSRHSVPPRARSSCEERRSTKSPISVVNIPSEHSLAAELQAERPATATYGQVFSMASGVAAEMTLDTMKWREQSARVRMLLMNPLPDSNNTEARRTINTPVNACAVSSTCLTTAARNHDVIEEEEETDECNPSHTSCLEVKADSSPDPKCQVDVQVSRLKKEEEAPVKASQEPSAQVVPVVSITNPAAVKGTRPLTASSKRSQRTATPLHVVSISLPLDVGESSSTSTAHHTCNPQSYRTSFSPKKTTVVLGSGFKSSRYVHKSKSASSIL